MNKLWKLFVVFSVLLVFLVVPAFGKKPAEDPIPNPEPGKNEYSAVPNLSFPMIATDIIEMFYQKVWVDDGDGLFDEKEFELGYDSTGDGFIDNTIGDGVPIPIVVAESIEDVYGGLYPGNVGFYYQTYVVDEGMTQDLLTQEWSEDGEWSSLDGSDGKPDLTDPIDMVTWFESMEDWYDQPVSMDGTLQDTVCTLDGLCADIPAALNPNNIWNVAYLLYGVDADNKEIVGGGNSWQAEWRLETENTIYIDFIDWGNPLENTVYPIVGQRFPVEMAIYEKVASTVPGDAGGDPMTAYKMGCIEYPSTRDEVFGTSTLTTDSFTTEIAFATVLTNKYFAEVWNPNGTITPITIEPGIGPSGKINFASAGGGWIPTMTGWHRIWIHFTDPLIDLSYAIVNNDEHYIMSSGFMAEPLNKNKLELVGIVGNSTFIDVEVMKPSGRNAR
jgi:hypothetical protein